jgi:signal transduction histidine kinase
MTDPTPTPRRAPTKGPRASLRRRFIAILGLAVVALTAATLAVGRLREERASERERAAFRQGDEVTEMLTARLAATPEGARALGDFTASMIAPLIDASAGFCDAEGTLALTRTVAPVAFEVAPIARPPGEFGDHHGPGHPPGEFGAHRAPGLLPLDRDVVVEACRRRRDAHVRFAAPNDLLFVTVKARAQGVSAWALVRMPNRARLGTSRAVVYLVAILGVVTLLLVVLTADALWMLRRGTSDLERALSELPRDLHADVPQPRAEELARVADALRTMAHDLSEGRDRERTLERRLDHEQRLAGLGRVVAGVAHEVRNPITGMKLKLDAMARRRLDERSARDVTACLDDLARLDRVVSSLLLVARKDAPARVAVDLGALVDERVAAAEGIASPRRVTLKRVGEATTQGDRDRLARVVDNLLRNAVEASPVGDLVRVVVEGGAAGAKLSVIDRGEGVPAARAGELFEPFFTLRPEGTGLGLFLSRAVVESHGGAITYERDGDETRFVVTLPAEAPHA